MALHPDITRKDDVSLALETAVDALLLASTQQTGNAGSVTIPNADGTKTLMGADAGDTTVARFVGRVTPPNRPTGIQAESHMGTLFVAWDGTLNGGMDAAFLFTRITISYADVYGDHSIDLGDLRGKGSVGSTTLPAGTVVTVTAHAYDDAHDDTGRSMPNVSEPSDPITVTIVDEAAQLEADVTADIGKVSDKADRAQAAADKANDANTKLRSDVAARLDVVDGTVSGVRTDVDKATAAAAKNANDIDTANTKIVQTNTRVDGVSTTISNVSNNADSALSLATQNHQDLTGFQTTVQQTYSTKEDTLSQVSAVSQKADSISAVLSKDYQKKTDAEATYATKTALQATASGITASVSETYATKSVVQALQNIADNAIETWQGHGVPSMTGEPTSGWTTPEFKKQHSGDMYYDLDSGYSYRFGSEDGSTYAWSKIADSDITKAMQAAAAAQSTADKNTDAVSKLNTDIPATYATKSDVKITTDGIKADVSKAMTLGQTGIDNASAVNQKADGIQATVTQQAQTLSDNVKAIAQVNMRADSLSTSITQVNTKTDLALQNSQELLLNGDVSTDASHWDLVNASTYDSTEHAIYYNGSPSDPAYKIIFQQYITDHAVNYDRVFRARVDLKQKFAGSGSCRVEIIPGGPYSYDLNNNDIPSTSYETFSGDIKVPARKTVQAFSLRTGNHPSDGGFFAKNMSLQDVTDVVAAQSTANDALSQTSTLSQDLSGFKTSVGQTYETKTDSTAKNTALQQNLNGFKTSVASTYASKTDVADTYATKSDVTQTSDSLTSKISAVGTDATSALNKATTNQQNLDGFKSTVSSTYATKSALDSTNGNVSNAQNAASQALANAQELVVNGGFETGDLTGWTVSGVVAVLGLDQDSPHSGNYQARFAAGASCSQSINGLVSGHIIRCSFWQRGFYDRTATMTISFNGGPKQTVGSITGVMPYTRAFKDFTVPANTTTATIKLTCETDYIRFDDISVKDITEVAQLKSDVAATYATQSSVQQTATQITSQVEAKYATKDDVTSKYTALQQTDNAFDARIGTAQSTAANAKTDASNAQNRIGTIETLVHTDANGVRVGKKVNGAWSGYSVLMNANGSFDVLDPGGGVDARVNTDGLSVMDDTTNKLRLINRSVFNHDPILATASGIWPRDPNMPNQNGNRYTYFEPYDDACIRIPFTTNWNKSVRVDLGAYMAVACGNYGPSNGTVQLIIAYGWQLWKTNSDNNSTLVIDASPDRAVKCNGSLWQNNTQYITGGNMSGSFIASGLQSYTTYYLETRHGIHSNVPRTDAGYWFNWNTSAHWACVTPLS